MKNKKLPAYTLLELLVVLTIIGILMAVGMAAYTRVQNTAMKKAATMAMKQYRIAVVNFKIDNGRVPTDVNELLSMGYITKELAKDPWNQDFRLEYDEASNIMKVISGGADKKYGTPDDIVDEENL